LILIEGASKAFRRVSEALVVSGFWFSFNTDKGADMLTVDDKQLVISLESEAGKSLALTVLQAMFTWGMQCKWVTDAGFDIAQAVAIVKGEETGSVVMVDDSTQQEGGNA
jgi:hypothetical protein